MVWLTHDFLYTYVRTVVSAAAAAAASACVHEEL